jgi:signal transduction histidine kinase
VKVFAELHRKTQQLEVLNARMITLRDEEARRIARELHDSVGQLLCRHQDEQCFGGGGVS